MWLLTLLFAAASHGEADATAKRIDAAGDAGVIYTVSAGQAYSLEGSTGEAVADQEGRVRKITMRFFGETYRQDLAIYVENGKPVMAHSVTGRYRGGLDDPKVVGTSSERVYFDGSDKNQELAATAMKVAQPIIDCIAKAKGAAPSCEEVDMVFDPQPTDTDPRIKHIKDEFARTERERATYAKTDFKLPDWALTGTVYKTKTGELRLVAMDVAPKTHIDFYFAGNDLLFGLKRGDRTTRVYYGHDRVIRIVDTKNKRVRLNSDNISTHAQPLADYLTTAREQAALP